MQARLINRWDAVRNSFWFLPALMCFGSLVLALACTSLDGPTEKYFLDVAPWVGVSTSAARASLSAIASAMVSIAGIVFSVTLVILSVTSSQYGSRLLRTFMSDRVTQCALGVLVGTSLFCMYALAGIQSNPDGTSTANVSVIVGLILSTVSCAVLVWFIHHVASLIQAPNVIAVVARDLDASCNRLYPEHIGQASAEDREDVFDLDRLGSGTFVLTNQEGYVQALDADALLGLAVSYDVFIELRVKPGEFVEHDQIFAEAWPESAVVPRRATDKRSESSELDETFAHRVNDTLITGRRRTPRQDVECAMGELVEVAVRALSPGINDPFTAQACIDRLAATMGRLAERAMPRRLRHDDDGTPRIIARATTFTDLMDTAFNQIRQHGCQHVAIAIHLIQAFKRIAGHISTEEQRSSVWRQAEMLQREFRIHIQEPEDGDDFQQRYAELSQLLKQPSRFS